MVNPKLLNFQLTQMLQHEIFMLKVTFLLTNSNVILICLVYVFLKVDLSLLSDMSLKSNPYCSIYSRNNGEQVHDSHTHIVSYPILVLFLISLLLCTLDVCHSCDKSQVHNYYFVTTQ